MISIIAGSLIISLLHAVIPNHWLPVIALGKKEQWTLTEVTRVTFICALAHGVSTIVIGFVIAFLGAKIGTGVANFTSVVAPIILIAMGFIFIYRHHRHHHFHIEENVRNRRSKTAIITALVVAMFFSPCMEIEAYFLLAGTESVWLVWFIALLYLSITTTGMMLLVRVAYGGLLRLNWHALEHNAGIITGATLMASGLISFFIH